MRLEVAYRGGLMGIAGYWIEHDTQRQRGKRVVENDRTDGTL